MEMERNATAEALLQHVGAGCLSNHRPEPPHIDTLHHTLMLTITLTPYTEHVHPLYRILRTCSHHCGNVNGATLGSPVNIVLNCTMPPQLFYAFSFSIIKPIIVVVALQNAGYQRLIAPLVRLRRKCALPHELCRDLGPHAGPPQLRVALPRLRPQYKRLRYRVGEDRSAWVLYEDALLSGPLLLLLPTRHVPELQVPI